jgi:ubiquinone biosynthesis protein Coq4
MIDSSTATPNLTPNLHRFLAFVDSLTKPLGLHVPQIVEVEKLRSLPVGTLGHTLADFLDSHEFTPFTTGPRRKQLHDSVHVLTGYDTDPIGEAEVQAFLLGAKFSFVHVLLGLGLLRLYHKQQQFLSKPYPSHLFRERLWRAYQRGKHSQLDVDTWQVEDHWELPLTQVQALFQV